MGSLTPNSVQELEFEQRDVEVFRIPDARTRVDTVKNYFFPRLEVLLREALEQVKVAYSVDPYPLTSFVYHPSPRRTTKQTLSGQFFAAMGIAGKRRADRELTIQTPSGGYLSFHPAHLEFEVNSEGSIAVGLQPFRYQVAPAFVEWVSELCRQNQSTLGPALSLVPMSYTNAGLLRSLPEALEDCKLDPRAFLLFSPQHYFPATYERGLKDLIIAFVVLYPLLEATIWKGEGKQPQLRKLLEKLPAWLEIFEGAETRNEDENVASSVAPEIPELDPYRFVRAGVWWSVLARREKGDRQIILDMVKILR